MTNQILDTYLLELYKKDVGLAKILQFFLFQINRIDQQLENLIPFNPITSPEDASLYAPQGHTKQELPVDDRSMWTPAEEILGNYNAFPLGAKFFNRFTPNAFLGPVINGILPVTNGQKAIIVNVGAPGTTITFMHEAAGAQAEHRILITPGGVTGAHIVLEKDEAVYLWRDNLTQRWRAYKLGTGFVHSNLFSVDLGPVALHSGRVQIIASTFIPGKATFMFQAPGPHAGKGSVPDEGEMDQVFVVANCTTVMGLGTVINMDWVAVPGPVMGFYSFYAFQGF